MPSAFSYLILPGDDQLGTVSMCGGVEKRIPLPDSGDATE